MSSSHDESASSSRSGPAGGLRRVREEMATACSRAGRDPGSVTLIAASKTVPADTLARTVEADHWVYGENRVQEAQEKWPPLRSRFPGVELHLIGPLQTNKARDAVAVFDVIHSVDRTSLSEALARQCARQGLRPRLFVQVNTGAEPQKAGVLADEADAFLDICRGQHGLDVVGLMCIPPVGEPPEPHFTLLGRIAARNGLGCLSMGMSGDYATAIEHGATHVRVGSAIFGARSYPAPQPAGTTR
ncbi:YggS family pyridoxal phosphate-dependent enzyme [Streptomyces albus]|uniref:YggS family pyridoxal phosphate-dependent enzyme n=1 Tax=Streptomyces albus TaxID=1888 RepID=UPI00068B8B44|nr:YggS family pyridoxal phosphate-dependent enzyme [Streptomyces albus]